MKTRPGEIWLADLGLGDFTQRRQAAKKNAKKKSHRDTEAQRVENLQISVSLSLCGYPPLSLQEHREGGAGDVQVDVDPGLGNLAGFKEVQADGHTADLDLRHLPARHRTLASAAAGARRCFAHLLAHQIAKMGRKLVQRNFVTDWNQGS